MNENFDCIIVSDKVRRPCSALYQIEKFVIERKKNVRVKEH